MKESSRKRLTMEDARREVAEMEAEKDALYDSIREEAFRVYETGVIPSYLLGSEKEWLLKEVLLEMADIQVNDFEQLADRVSSFYDSWKYFDPSMLPSDKYRESIEREMNYTRISNVDLATLRGIESALIEADDLRNDKDIASAFAMLNPKYIDFFNPQLRKDQEFLKNVFHNNGLIGFERIADEILQNNKEFIMELISDFDTPPYLDLGEKGNEVLGELSDSDFMIDVVMKNANNFEHLSPELRANKEFVIQLINEKQQGDTSIVLSSCDETLKADREVALVAIRRNVRSIASISPDLMNDKDFVLQVISEANSNPEEEVLKTYSDPDYAGEMGMWYFALNEELQFDQDIESALNERREKVSKESYIRTIKEQQKILHGLEAEIDVSQEQDEYSND